MRKSGNGSAADGLRKVKSSISGTETYRPTRKPDKSVLRRLCPVSADGETGISSCVDFGILGYKPIRQSSGCRCRLCKRLNGHGLVVHDVEDGIQPCNLHQIVNLIREVEQLQFSLLLPHARESTDQMAQA